MEKANRAETKNTVAPVAPASCTPADMARISAELAELRSRMNADSHRLNELLQQCAVISGNDSDKSASTKAPVCFPRQTLAARGVSGGPIKVPHNEAVVLTLKTLDGNWQPDNCQFGIKASTGGTGFQVPLAGIYNVTAQFDWCANEKVAPNVQITIGVENGGGGSSISTFSNPHMHRDKATITAIVRMNANGRIYFQAYHNSAAPLVPFELDAAVVYVGSI